VRRQALTAAVLLLLPIAIGAVWLRSQSRRARTEELRQEAISVVSASAASFDRFLRGLDSVASALALNPSVIALNRAECDRLFAAVLRTQPSILNILLSAPDETIKGPRCRRPTRNPGCRCRTSSRSSRPGIGSRRVVGRPVDAQADGHPRVTP
jgi:hypothetical protein